MFDDLMIDLETLSLQPDAHILSLGAVWFDRYTGKLGPELYVVTDPTETNGHIDSVTVAWWAQQGGAARREVFAPPGETVTLGGLLRCLNHFIDSHWDRNLQSPTLWARGHMDPIWLEAAFHRENIGCEYDFRWWADQRTIEKVTGVTAQTLDGVQHHALDDCKQQIADLCAGLRCIRDGACDP